MTPYLSDVPVVGEVIADRYRLDQRVELSPLGTRWVATHVGLGSVVSVKLMSDRAASDPEAVARFRQEAVLVARIHSDHVLRVRDHGEHEGAPFIVTDHVTGHTLASQLSSGGRLGLAATAELLRQVAKALDAAHHLGMVHHDVKPSSILIGEELVEGERRVRLLDFGADAAAGSHPHYTSPERLRAQAGGAELTTLGPATDLWSLAVVVFECLTGRRPFDGEGHDALLLAIEGANAPPASALALGLPEAIDAWFEVTLSRDPTARFGSALAMSRSFRLAIGVGERPSEVATAPSFDDDVTFRTVRMQDEADASAPFIARDSAAPVTQSVGPGRRVVGSDGAATVPRATDLRDVDTDMAQLPHELAAERAGQLAAPVARPALQGRGQALAASAPWAHHVPSQAGLLVDHAVAPAAEVAADFADEPTRRRPAEVRGSAPALQAPHDEPVSMVLPFAYSGEATAEGHGGSGEPQLGHAWSPGSAAPPSLPPPQAIPGALHVPAFPAPMSVRAPYPGHEAGVVSLPEAWVDIAAAPPPTRRVSVGVWIGALLLTLVGGGGVAYVLTDGFGRHHATVEAEDESSTSSRRRRRARSDESDEAPGADAATPSGSGGGAPETPPSGVQPDGALAPPVEPQPPPPVPRPPSVPASRIPPPVSGPAALPGPGPKPAPNPTPSAAPGSHRRSLD